MAIRAIYTARSRRFTLRTGTVMKYLRPRWSQRVVRATGLLGGGVGHGHRKHLHCGCGAEQSSILEFCNEAESIKKNIVEILGGRELVPFQLQTQG